MGSERASRAGWLRRRPTEQPARPEPPSPDLAAITLDRFRSLAREIEAVQEHASVLHDQLDALVSSLGEDLDLDRSAPDEPDPSGREDRGRDRPPAADPGAPELAVHCFGELRVFLDAEPIASWHGRRGRGVFEYLVLHRRRPVPREVLMETFWPEADPEAARNNLNVALHCARTALRSTGRDLPFITHRDGCYSFDAQLRLWVDVEEFETLIDAAARHGRLQRPHDELALRESAALMYSGHLLADERYDAWVEELRRRAELIHLANLDWISRHHLRTGHPAACIQRCEQILACEPTNETAHRRMMIALARAGMAFRAIHQFQVCTEVLSGELDTTPSARTQEIFELVRSHRDIPQDAY